MALLFGGHETPFCALTFTALTPRERSAYCSGPIVCSPTQENNGLMRWPIPIEFSICRRQHFKSSSSETYQGEEICILKSPTPTRPYTLCLILLEVGLMCLCSTGPAGVGGIQVGKWSQYHVREHWNCEGVMMLIHMHEHCYCYRDFLFTFCFYQKVRNSS